MTPIEPGTRPWRPEYRIEGPAKVTGSALYTADFDHDGALEVAFTRSPLPHARIVSVDVTEAAAMAGVEAIITGRDVRGMYLGRRLQDWPILAWDTVRMVGDRVAAVAARTRAQAIAAARAVDVEYEELPAVLDIDQALAAGAPVLHTDPGLYRYIGDSRPPTSHPNVQGERFHEYGDVDSGFAGAAHVFDHTFSIARSYTGYLEPKASMVWLVGDEIHVLTTNKSPFRLKEQMAIALDIDPESLVITTGHIGGDFGGKGISVDEHALVVLARMTGRRVRTVASLADDVASTSIRHGGRIRLRTAVDEEGRFLAHEAWVDLDGGAYAAGKPNTELVAGKANFTMTGYHIPAARTATRTIYTNTVPGGNARSPGQPQTAFAAESHVDLIAAALNLDPLELRKANAVRPGQIDISGVPVERSMVTHVIEVLERELASAPVPSGFTRGIAMGTRSMPSGSAAVRIGVGPGGMVEVSTGVTDQGTGAYTMLQRVVAEELAIPLDRVQVGGGGTEGVPFDQGVGGSRVTPIVGGAARSGAGELRLRLDASYPGLEVEEQLDAAAAGGDVEVIGEFTHPKGLHSVAACFADVAVDRETGVVTVASLVVIGDVGTVINPLGAMGQMMGGAANGYGFAMMEELQYEDGVMTTANLDGYKIPSVRDMPEVRVVLIDDDKGPGPFGAKSVGELANFLPAPAIANAVRRACGIDVSTVPMTAERIYSELRKAATR